MIDGMKSNPNTKPDLDKTLKEINDLVYQPGYIYSLSIIILHDLFLTLDNYGDVDWHSRVSYQEAGFLFGLLLKRPIDLSILPNEEDSSKYIANTYHLLQQLHDHYGLKAFSSMIEESLNKSQSTIPLNKTSIFTSPEAIVESVFYGDSGAYDFQYWETAPKRYQKDVEWIIENLGFSIEESIAFSKATKELSEKKRLNIPPKDNFATLCRWALDVFSFDPRKLNLREEGLQNLLTRFSAIPGESNQDLNTPADFNELEVKPLIKISPTQYVLPVSFDLARSIDESPFYWIKELDKDYFSVALKHRGEYTEEVAYKILQRVFGEANVYKGVKVQRLRGDGIRKRGIDYTDIDVLALLGNKALVVQAKSKKMTVLSRKGNLVQLGKDFKSAVQDAYDQGLESRIHLLSKDAKFLTNSGEEIQLSNSIDEVYILTVSTDNYPALYMQVHAFLEKKEEDPWPIAINIFDLELLATYLPDPYDFLYYVNQRVLLADKIMGGTEIASLGYHLDQKLYVDPTSPSTRIALMQDFAQLIDDDIIRQKYGTEEDKAKSRIRQKWKNSSFIELVSQIKSTGDPRIVDAIFFLYTLSSETADKLVGMMREMKLKSQKDGKPHTMAMPLDTGLGGITYVVRYEESTFLGKHLMTYSVARKYLTKANEWLGLGSYANSPKIIDAVTYTKEAWKQDQKLQKLVEMVINPGQVITRKIGRNDPCYCGSGRKYKKCCYLKGG